MTDTTEVAAPAVQTKLSKFIKFKNPFVMAGIGSVGSFVLLCIANGLDIFQGVIVPDHFFSEYMIQSRFVSIIATAIFGFGLGWFFSPKAKAFRIMLLGGLIGVLGFFIIVDYGVLGSSSATLSAILVFLVGLGFWTGGTIKRFRKPPTTFGSAAWASFQEIWNKGMITLEGFRLGFVFDTDGMRHPLSYVGDRHMGTIAPNRSGKGTCSIIPNLLTHEGSVIVIDPKGENSMITVSQRKRMGQAVHVIDPWSITGMETSHFNPIDWLKAGDIDISDNAMLLADAIIIMSGGNETFWDEEAKALLLGVMLYVAIDPSEKGQRHLGRVRDLLLLDGEELIKLFKRMLKSPLHVVRSTGARCLQKEEKLLSNVLASVQAQTHFLDSPRLRESLSRSDFTFEELKENPTSIYLVLPADRLNSHGRWLRLLIQQALTVSARNIEKKPKKSVLFILDELPALGRLTMVEQAFGLMAGFGIQLHAICQDLSQLKRIYGDGWETFISNAGVIQYFGSRDQFTAEYFSKLCGVTTVWDISTGLSRALGASRGKDTSTSETTTTSDTTSGKQRQLAYADELMRMPEKTQLVLIENMNPILAEKKPWFKNPELKDLGVNLHELQADTEAGIETLSLPEAAE